MMLNIQTGKLHNEEEKKAIRNRLATIESARKRRNKMRKRSLANKSNEKRAKTLSEEKADLRAGLEGIEKTYNVYQPTEEPAFFDLSVEKRHCDHLGKRTLDKESRLQVIYRILKDQLRVAKKTLL